MTKPDLQTCAPCLEGTCVTEPLENSTPCVSLQFRYHFDKCRSENRRAGQLKQQNGTSGLTHKSRLVLNWLIQYTQKNVLRRGA